MVRHGETDWNHDGRWQGHAGPGLNDLGRIQARAVADRLAGIDADALYTSDLDRATETAAIIAAATGLEPIVAAGLREVDVGSWSGLTRGEVEKADPDGYARWVAGGHGWRGGESYGAMHERVIAEVGRLFAAHPSGTILAVAHGGTVRALACEAVEIPHDRNRIAGCENCSVTEVTNQRDLRMSLVAYNDRGHLPSPDGVA